MRQSASSVVRGASPLHLLRALLRECTYLPDSAARERMHKDVIARFRSQRSSSSLPRQTNLLQAARKALSLLRRANDGRTAALFKVLALTYGRTGKRRHILLQSVLEPDIPADHTAVAALSASAKPKTAESEVSPRFQALLNSQADRPGLSLIKPAFKSARPAIPEMNAWRRPVPACRVRNIKKRWLHKMKDRAMPPLPKSEMERLRCLVHGELKWDGPVPRRAHARTSSSDRGDSTLDILVRSRIPARQVFPGRNTNSGNPHIITKRLMRRLWGRILTQCPSLIWNDRRKSWEVEWGIVRDSKDTEPADTAILELNLFDGVDDKGRLPSPGKSQPLRKRSVQVRPEGIA